MSHVPHELHDEFPDKIDRMHDLKVSNEHFRKIFDEYHEINRAVHRAEANTEPTGQFHEEDMRKQRMRLKDEIARMLA